jgi:aspartokinase/homoserine dehydrogenase 1
LQAEVLDKRLRFIATLEDGKASIGLRAVDSSHPFYNLNGSENIISFTTERYKAYPLVVKGPGAGAEVTAMGVFADIMSISSFNE